MSTYNGFEPGEYRVVSRQRPRKADNGHTVVLHATRRNGYAFAFTYIAECQCGKRFTGLSISTIANTHSRHVRKETV